MTRLFIGCAALTIVLALVGLTGWKLYLATGFLSLGIALVCSYTNQEKK